jgi:hypothetical protein
LFVLQYSNLTRSALVSASNILKHESIILYPDIDTGIISVILIDFGEAILKINTPINIVRIVKTINPTF